MSSAITTLLRSIFPHAEGRMLVLGLDGTGRTTWLYANIISEIVSTIPTIGFNVEVLKKNGVDLTFWDVGGCDKIRPLWRHYFHNTNGIAFFVDSTDHPRMDEAAGELGRLLGEDELRGAFVIVIANKQDLPNALSPAQVSARLRLPETLNGRHWVCMPGRLPGGSPIDTELLNTHVNWIHTALKNCPLPGTPEAPRRALVTEVAAAPANKAAPASGHGDAAGGAAGGGGGGGGAATAAGGGSSAATVEAAVGGGDGDGGEMELLERWLQVVDEPDDEFIRKLEDFSLEVWDHRTHLRLAWVYLTRHGRREGLNRVHASIQAFIANSPVTKRKNGTTYHETMTYFWAHMVHFAIASQKTPAGLAPSFRLFLVLNPQLSNGGLFLHYYSKQLMLMSPESRKSVVLPDKRPLPSMITDVAAIKTRASTGAAAPPGPVLAKPLSDDAFLARFLSRSLDRWNHECLLRAIYVCLRAHGRRRGGNIALDALAALQGSGAHLTINYFWLAVVTHTLASEHAPALFAERKSSGASPVQPPPAATATAAVAGAGAQGKAVAADAAAEAMAAVALKDGEPNDAGAAEAAPPQLPEWQALLDSGSYASVRLKELVADEHKYLAHYTKQLIYSDGAAAAFMPPDKRPLPSTV